MKFDWFLQVRPSLHRHNVGGNITNDHKVRQLVMSKIILFFLSLVLIGCASMHWSNYFPYMKVNPNKMYLSQPVNYEDCLNQFDTILSDNVIKHFKALDSTIASIEISNEIGNLFINHWNLAYYSKRNPNIYHRKYNMKPPVIDKFIADSLSDPQAMIRVMFSCYHKKLNNIPYDWKYEIDKIRTYWVGSELIYNRAHLRNSMKKYEYKILLNHHYNQLKLADTVDVLYNRAPRLNNKSPDWYYLTGIIKDKYPENKHIDVELIKIQSEFGAEYILSKNDTITIGDTLNDFCKGWLRRGSYYFNYHRNKEYRYDFNDGL
jgi:hypothetical protein